MPKITLSRIKNKVLDGEALYYVYWHDMGEARSIRKLSKKLVASGVFSKVSGKVPTDMAIWFSMWRWAGNNSDEAYQIFNDAMRDEGLYYTRDEFEEFLQNKIWTVVKKNRKVFDKWLRANKKKNLIPESMNSLEAGA